MREVIFCNLIETIWKGNLIIQFYENKHVIQSKKSIRDLLTFAFFSFESFNLFVTYSVLLW